MSGTASDRYQPLDLRYMGDQNEAGILIPQIQDDVPQENANRVQEPDGAEQTAGSHYEAEDLDDPSEQDEGGEEAGEEVEAEVEPKRAWLDQRYSDGGFETTFKCCHCDKWTNSSRELLEKCPTCGVVRCTGCLVIFGTLRDVVYDNIYYDKDHDYESENGDDEHGNVDDQAPGTSTEIEDEDEEASFGATRSQNGSNAKSEDDSNMSASNRDGQLIVNGEAQNKKSDKSQDEDNNIGIEAAGDADDPGVEDRNGEFGKESERRKGLSEVEDGIQAAATTRKRSSLEGKNDEEDEEDEEALKELEESIRLDLRHYQTSGDERTKDEDSNCKVDEDELNGSRATRLATSMRKRRRIVQKVFHDTLMIAFGSTIAFSVVLYAILENKHGNK